VDAVSGKAQLQAMGGPTGLRDRDFLVARGVAGVTAVAPVVEATTVAPDWVEPGTAKPPPGETPGQPVTVLGIDLFSEPPFRSYTLTGSGDRASGMAFLANPRAIAVTDRLAEEHGLKIGSRIRLMYGTKASTWTVTSLIQSDSLSRAYAGQLAVVDIAAAQEAFGKLGRLDRLDIRVAPGADIEEVRSRLEAALGGGAAVRRPQARSEQVESLLGAFQLNLTALSAIAIFVGMFLIYNAMSIAVVRRRREIGILRALGATRRQILALFLAEGAFFGVVGAALGVLAGIVMARAALHAVAATVTALYVRVEAERLALDPVLIGQAVLIGFGTAVLASLAPAREAASTPPGQTSREGSLAARARPAAAGLLVAGLALLALAGAMSWGAGAWRQPWLGFAAAFAILGGFSLVTPMVTAALAAMARPVRNRLFGAEGQLAAGYISVALDRTSVVVAALMVSLAMFVGVSVMVGSFRRTVQAWEDQTLVADLFVRYATWNVSGEDAVLPPAVVAGLRKLPGVAAVDAYRAISATYENSPIVLSASTFDVLADRGRLLFRHGDTARILRDAKANGEIVVTEGFTLKLGKAEGDTVTLYTPDGPRPFRIAGVYYDYTTSGPTVVMDIGLYRKLWHDDAVNSVAVYLESGADAAAALADIEQRFGGGVATIANRALHDQVLRIFDQTFRVTYAPEFISIAVAVLGIINTMTALILQRGRELGILRAVGATRRQLRKMILLESALIGLIGFIIGAVCGGALALLLIYVINKQFFGWTVQVHWTPAVFVEGAAIMIVTSLLAGLLPARQAGLRSVTEAVRAE
jgi:putative ABC transport system permease protein